MKKLLKVLALTLGALAISGATAFASTLVEGNDTNHESHIHEMENAKIDPPTQGSHLIADGRIEVIIKDSKVADIKVLDESINVEYVHMKGGNSFNCYDYVGEPLNGISQETDLNCPTNNSGNNADISHITVYWEEKEEEVIPPVEPELPLIPLEPSIPVEPPTEPELPLIPLEPSVPVEPELPLIPLEPSIPVEPSVPPVVEEELPLIPLEPSVPPVIEEEEVKPPTIENVPTLPQTGGESNIMLIFTSLGMVGTGLKLFKRK